MTELYLNNGTIVLFSYETPVIAFNSNGFDCVLENGKTRQFKLIKTNKKYSKTTSKHINQYCVNYKKLDPNYTIEVDQSVLDNLVR